MQPPLDDLREQLLRTGLVPRHVNRYVTELREHLRDLATQERAAGLDARQAATLSLAAVRAAVLFAIAAIAYGALRARLMPVRARTL